MSLPGLPSIGTLALGGLAAMAVGLAGYVAGRHDGRRIEASATAEATLRAQAKAVDEARAQLRIDSAIAADRARSIADLTDSITALLSARPPAATAWKETPTHGAATVRCAAGVSPEFLRDWNAAADIASAARGAHGRDGSEP